MSKIHRASLQNCALEAKRIKSVLSCASSASLFSKVAAIEACKNNPYQPSLIWHPTIFDCMMQLDLRETVSQEIFLTGAFEADVLWLLSTILSEGASVIDAGSHIGFFSLAMGILVGSTGRIDAFEPTLATRNHLETNIRNANLKNVYVHGMALWSHPTVLSMLDWGHSMSAYNGIASPRVNDPSKLPNLQTFKIAATSIDAFANELTIYPNLIKIDVQGSEFRVVQGMTKTLSSYRPSIILEVGDFAETSKHTDVRKSKETIDLILQYEYLSFEIKNFSLIPLSTFSDNMEYSNLFLVGKERVQEFASIIVST